MADVADRYRDRVRAIERPHPIRRLLTAIDGLSEHQIDAVCAFAELLNTEHASPALSDAEFVRTRLGASRGQTIIFPVRGRS
ncbi:MAG: hypothetical protein HQL36_03625 [Alphaproteobacteria bacterium]|nr:hypothetical protein [Alphaproteobacteria bacterium]MBF0249926.1 hypothetical protein [Alphaproteobacteria bacterium]